MSAAVTKLLTNTPQDFTTPGSVEIQAWPVDDGWSAAGIDADDAWPANTIGIDETWAGESAGACKVSPFLNWYDVGSCFFSDSWQIESKSAFIISCLGVLIYAAGFQVLCRWAKTCDCVMAGAQDVKPSDRFNVWADLGRAGIYTLRALYLLQMMMLVVYFNAWYMLCMLLGTFLGFFFFEAVPTWMQWTRGSSFMNSSHSLEREGGWRQFREMGRGSRGFAYEDDRGVSVRDSF